MSKKTSRKQKIYRMKGCSKTRKNYLGGSVDAPLAYTGKPVPSTPNSFLAYTGKGGSSCGLNNTANIPINTNSANPAYPNTGPVSAGSNIIFNNASPQRGGNCASCSAPLMTGGCCGSGFPMMNGGRRKKGGCGPFCAMGFMVGGMKHRSGCKCSECKKRRISGGMKGGNIGGKPYADGLVGTPWTPNVEGWPGVEGVPGDSNYYPVNQYKVDPQTAIVDLGANPPFLNMKAGKGKKQKGGTLSNLMGQDLINLGRQFQFGIGSAYNALAGYPSPVNPLPWKDQFHTKTLFNPVNV